MDGEPWRDLTRYVRDLQRSRDRRDRAILWRIEHGPTELARQRAACRRAGIPLTPEELWPPAPLAENSAPLYDQWQRQRREQPVDVRPKYLLASLGARYAPTTEQASAIRDVLLKRRDVFESLHRAADKPGFYRKRQDSGARLMVLLIKDYATLREAAREIHGESWMAAHDGRYREAVESQTRGFRVAAHAGLTPGVTGYLVSAACHDIALAGIREILAMAGPDSSAADAVRGAVTDQPFRSDLRRAAAGEVAAFDIPGIRKEGPVGLTEFVASSSANEPSRAPAVRPPDSALWNRFMDAVEADYLRRQRDLVAASAHPYRDAVASFQRIQRELDRAASDPITAFSRKVVSPAAQVLVLRERIAAREAVAIAAAALLGYRARNARYPGRLEEVVPPGLGTRVRDPFTGRPLKYRREGDGFVVYSVGARGDFSPPPPDGQRASVEAFFRYPPPPAAPLPEQDDPR